MRRVRFLAATLALASSSACMTLDTQFDEGYDGPQVYSGVRKDAAIFGPAFLHLSLGWVAITLIDFPFSFVADTLLLPVTISRDAAREREQAEALAPERERPGPVRAKAGETPLVAARRVFDECRDRLRRHDQAFSDCYAVDARVEVAGAAPLGGSAWKVETRAALARLRAADIYLDWREPELAPDGERVRIRATRKSSREPAESPVELVLAPGADGDWRIVFESSVGWPER